MNNLPNPKKESNLPIIPAPKQKYLSKEQIITISKKIRNAKIKLLIEQPFFGLLMLQMKIIPTYSIDRIFTNTKEIYYNPNYFIKLSFEEIKSSLFHEILHCVLDHIRRGADKRLELWEMATDYALAFLILESGMKLPKEHPYESSYKNWSAEKIYKKLFEKWKKNQKSKKDLRINKNCHDTAPNQNANQNQNPQQNQQQMNTNVAPNQNANQNQNAQQNQQQMNTNATPNQNANQNQNAQQNQQQMNTNVAPNQTTSQNQNAQQNQQQMNTNATPNQNANQNQNAQQNPQQMNTNATPNQNANQNQNPQQNQQQMNTNVAPNQNANQNQNPQQNPQQMNTNATLNQNANQNQNPQQNPQQMNTNATLNQNASQNQNSQQNQGGKTTHQTPTPGRQDQKSPNLEDQSSISTQNHLELPPYNPFERKTNAFDHLLDYNQLMMRKIQEKQKEELEKTKNRQKKEDFKEDQQEKYKNKEGKQTPEQNDNINPNLKNSKNQHLQQQKRTKNSKSNSDVDFNNINKSKLERNKRPQNSKMLKNQDTNPIDNKLKESKGNTKENANDLANDQLEKYSNENFSNYSNFNSNFGDPTNFPFSPGYDGNNKENPFNISTTPQDINVEEILPTKEDLEVFEGKMREAYTAAKDQGRLPSYIKRYIKKLFKPKIPWQNILARYLISYSKVDYNWLPPAYKYLPSGLVLPSIRIRKIDLVIAIDTSGSISNEELRKFMTEVKGIISQFNSYTLKIIACDANIHEIHEFETFKPFDFKEAMKLSGGGGTDFRPVFNYIEKEKKRPDCLVYMTDLYGDFPYSKPNYPVIWLCTSEEKAPFGVTIKYEID